MKTKGANLKVGDTVVLNDCGLTQIYGKTRGHQHMKTLRMKVTEVDAVSLTYPEETFPVSVDNADIDQFLIDNWCFDKVTA